MTTLVYCTCGARYSRTEIKVRKPSESSIACRECGAILEACSSVSVTMPAYELLVPGGQKPVGVQS